MRIIIAGCGKVGFSIIEALIPEGHDVVVIDTNSDRITEITNRFDIMGIVGNAASYNVQIEAGIEDAHLLIASTNSDELNLLCCMIAKKTGNCRTIARVRNPVYNEEINFIKEELGLSMAINPEAAAAMEISRLLRFPSAIKIDTFAKGKVELLEFEISEDSILANKSLIDVSRHIKTDILICGVQRGEDVFIPNGRFVLREGDKITIVASYENSRKFFKEIGYVDTKIRDVLIVGGGRIAYYLAKMLPKEGIALKIIEKDRARCEELSTEFDDVIIINGDATNQELLIEEGVENTSAFITLTGIDEGNIFLSLFAKSRKTAKVITKINRLAFDDIVDTFHLGSIISPKSITSEYVLRYIRAMQNTIGSNVETLHKVIDKKAEALEFYIQEDCPLVDKALEDLHLKENLLIACINHKGHISIPNGQSKIGVGDTVIVVTTNTGLNDIKDILE